METLEKKIVAKKAERIEDWQIDQFLQVPLSDKITDFYEALRKRIFISSSSVESIGPTINVEEDFSFKIVITNLSSYNGINAVTVNTSNQILYPAYPIIKFKDIKLDVKENRNFAELKSVVYRQSNIPVRNGMATCLFPKVLGQGSSFIVEVKMKAKQALDTGQNEVVLNTELEYTFDFEEFFKFYRTSPIKIDIEP